MAEPDNDKPRRTFFDLPPDIRNRIYEECLIQYKCAFCWERMLGVCEHACCDIRYTDYGEEPDKIWPDFIPVFLEDEFPVFPRPQPPLTRVSKAVRSETLPMFYGLNTFFDPVTMWGHLFLKFKAWIKQIGVGNVKMLKRLNFGLRKTLRYKIGYLLSEGEKERLLGDLRGLGVDTEKCEVRFTEDL